MPKPDRQALDEIGAAFDRYRRGSGRSRRGCSRGGPARGGLRGREGLGLRGPAMRPFNLGRSVSVVGGMTALTVGAGDPILAACGPGEISTAVALVGVAEAAAGARVPAVMAQPGRRVPCMTDHILVVPARTMANDRGAEAATLPMGSVFDVMVRKLKARLGVSAEAMWADRTDLE